MNNLKAYIKTINIQKNKGYKTLNYNKYLADKKM